MNRLILLVLIFNSGCASWFSWMKDDELTPAGGMVVVSPEITSRECKFVSKVEGWDNLMSKRANAITRARNTAGDKGANLLIITKTSSQPNRAVWGEAWSCPGPKKVPVATFH